MEAFNLGATGVTHMFNAMSGLSGRVPGLVGASLMNKDCYVGLIADMQHVHEANIQLTKALKGDKIYLVTDALFLGAIEGSRHDFYGQDLTVREGACFNINGKLGGTVVTMNQCIKNCVEKCSITLEESLAMSTIIPAKMMKIDSHIGKIGKGYRADLILLNIYDYSCKVL